MTAPKISADEDADSSKNDEAALERVMAEVPRGALALAVLTVGSLIVVWFIFYAFVFLPRGTVG